MTALALALALQVDGLIDRLSADDIDTRESATLALIEHGGEIEARLTAALKAADDFELRERLQRIVGTRGHYRHSRLHLLVVLEDGTTLQGGASDRAAPHEEILVYCDHTLVGVEGRFRADGRSFDLQLRVGGMLKGRVEGALGRTARVETDGGRPAFVWLRYASDGVRWDAREPMRSIAPLLRADVERPAGADVPDAFRLLMSRAGFRSLIPDLRRRAEETRDPFVRRLCERAIAKQEEEP